MVNDPKTLYIEACRRPSDINEHLLTLATYAERCHHITELGTRYGTSATALCWGISQNPKTTRANRLKVVSYDISIYPGSNVVLAAFPGLFSREIGDSTKIDIEKTDLLFVDTVHTYRQVLTELTRHAPQVRKWIILHDTETFGRVGDDGGPGILKAIEEFLLANSDHWFTRDHFSNNNGLTILERRHAI